MKFLSPQMLAIFAQRNFSNTINSLSQVDTAEPRPIPPSTVVDELSARTPSNP